MFQIGQGMRGIFASVYRGGIQMQSFERSRLISLCRAAIVGCAATGASLLVDSAARAATTVFSPVADTEVDVARPSINFGRASLLAAKGNSARIAYLRFNVSIPAGEVVTKATLRLFTTSSSYTGLFAHAVASTTWGETTTTYSNAPAVGT